MRDKAGVPTCFGGEFAEFQCFPRALPRARARRPPLLHPIRQLHGLGSVETFLLSPLLTPMLSPRTSMFLATWSKNGISGLYARADGARPIKRKKREIVLSRDMFANFEAARRGGRGGAGAKGPGQIKGVGGLIPDGL